jgi:hypothetical protein
MFNPFLRFKRLCVVAVCFISISACDDPSSIGLELVDPQSGATEVRAVGSTLAESSGIADITGGTTTEGAFRSLFGKVNDPVAGSFFMIGYVDFISSTNVTSAFRAAPVTFADLEFNIDYVYGDTTQPLTFNLYEVDQAWNSSDVRSDTFLVAQTLVTTATLMPASKTIHVPLPQSWVNQHDTALRSTTFVDDFHGFALQATQGDAVLGVHYSGSSIRASSVPGDTVNFSMSKVLSASSFRDDTANTEFITLRDGAAETLSVKFPLEPSEFGEVAIHRTIIRLNSADVSGLYGPQFKRPGVIRVGLRAVAVDNQTRLNVVTADVNFDGSLSFDSATLTNILQSENLGDSGLDRFELYFPRESSTVDVLAFKRGLPSELGPRAIITFTSIN